MRKCLLTRKELIVKRFIYHFPRLISLWSFPRSFPRSGNIPCRGFSRPPIFLCPSDHSTAYGAPRLLALLGLRRRVLEKLTTDCRRRFSSIPQLAFKCVEKLAISFDFAIFTVETVKVLPSNLIAIIRSLHPSFAGRDLRGIWQFLWRRKRTRERGRESNTQSARTAVVLRRSCWKP